MWPLEGRRARECLRVGALAVERWVSAGQGLSLAGSQALPVGARQDPAGLIAAIAALYPAAPSVKVGLVLESAWMPVLLADTGGRLWSSAQVDLLLRHQMEMAHGDGTQAMAGWALRSAHRLGARHALGYGLAPAVKSALVEAGRGVGIGWHELVPAWAWGWHRLRAARRASAAHAWWLWPEQDRCLLACLEGGELVGLNTAAAVCADGAAVERAVATEALRQGLVADARPLIAASWLSTLRLAPSRGRLRWASIVGPEHAAIVPADSAATATSPGNAGPPQVSFTPAGDGSGPARPWGRP